MALLIESLKKLFNKFTYAFSGLKYALKYDCSIQLQTGIAIIAVLGFIILGIPLHQWLWIVSAIFAVVISEFINSVFEQICNLVHPEYSTHVKIIKDMGSAFVLLAALYSIIVAAILVAINL